MIINLVTLEPLFGDLYILNELNHILPVYYKFLKNQ